MNSGVVFYSRNNNTRTAALYLAGNNSAEIVELVEENGGKDYIESKIDKHLR